MSKSAAAKAGEETVVQGVNVVLIKMPLVNKALKAAGVDIEEMSATEKVEALQFANRKLAKKVTCTVCGGIGNAEETACPFCGDEGEDDQEDEEDEASEEEEPKASPKKSTPPQGAKRGSPQTSLRRVGSTDIVSEFSEEALDECNKHIFEIRERAKHDYWELGQALAKVYDSGVWKARMKGGKVAYTSFNQYVNAELAISHTSAFNMMDVARKFTEEKVKKIGGAKLALVLMAPKDEQPSILEEVEKGASRKQIKQKVKEARKKKGVTKRDTGRKTMPKGKPGAKAKGRITIAMVESTKTYDLFVKPDKALKDGEKPTKLAKGIADHPWTLIKLQNGVEQIIEIVGGKGGWKVKITTRRR